MRLAHNADELREKVEAAVQELADRGFRALGVGISYTGQGEEAAWEFQGVSAIIVMVVFSSLKNFRVRILQVLSLFDPPRPDTKATIAAAIANGVEVKMITGDQTAIAKETCRELGMGTNILNTEVLNDKSMSVANLDNVSCNYRYNISTINHQLSLVAFPQIILQAHGFAEVMPEHKFQIVDRIRQNGHVTGMTGDGMFRGCAAPYVTEPWDTECNYLQV